MSHTQRERFHSSKLGRSGGAWSEHTVGKETLLLPQTDWVFKAEITARKTFSEAAWLQSFIVKEMINILSESVIKTTPNRADNHLYEMAVSWGVRLSHLIDNRTVTVVRPHQSMMLSRFTIQLKGFTEEQRLIVHGNTLLGALWQGISSLRWLWRLRFCGALISHFSVLQNISQRLHFIVKGL